MVHRCTAVELQTIADLSINRYKEVVHETSEYRPPREIIAELKVLEREIAEGLDELEGMW